MRLFFITLLFSLCTYAAQAQVGTRLEFSQVRLLSTTTNGTVNLGTVPAGKVWKITGFSSQADGYNRVCALSFDGSSIALNMGGAYLSSSASQLMADFTDFWLPENTSIYALSCGVGYYRWVSVIEFSVLP